MPRVSSNGAPSIGGRDTTVDTLFSLQSHLNPSFLTPNPCPETNIQPGIRKSY